MLKKKKKTYLGLIIKYTFSWGEKIESFITHTKKREKKKKGYINYDRTRRVMQYTFVSKSTNTLITWSLYSYII